MTPIRQATLLILAMLISSSRSFLLPGAPETNNQQTESPDEPFTSFSYAGTTVNIYRVQRRQAIYQFEPVAVLDRSTVDSWYSGVNNQHVLGFQLRMWNETLRHAATDHLTQFTGHSVRPHQVQSMPFDKVILKTAGDEVDERLQTAHSWTPYSQTVSFTLVCFENCRQIAQEFKSDPDRFAHFRLAYSTDGRRRTEIKSIDFVQQSTVVQSSQLMNKINSRYPRSAEVLLVATDAQHLLWNLVSAIVRENFRDEPDAVVTKEAHKIIYDQLEKILVAGKLSVGADNSKWSNVYWEDPLSRPDAVARSLNERLRRIQQEDYDDGQQDWKEKTKEAVDELYQQHKEFVIFDEEKYLPKTVQVFRMKLNAIRERRLDLDNIQVPYHPSADLVTPIIHDGPYYSMGLIIPSELRHNEPEELQEEKSVISRLIDGKTLVVRLRNARTGEYLYPGSDNLSHDAKRRRVFTWRNKDEVVGPWAEWHLSGMWRAGTFRVRFTSVRFPGEYLYPATDDLSFDKDRRRVFTWRQISKPEDVHLWADGAADWLLDTYRVNSQVHSHRYALFNLKRREYLYVARDQLALDDTRRRVFTWRGPENEVWAELKNQWDIEVVRSA